HYYEEYGMKTYIVRFHNIYGPLGTYDGGREKSPAAFCRKIALAKREDEIEVWGDGKMIEQKDIRQSKKEHGNRKYPGQRDAL
ncbi:unnamed protein product, partial [marine sediment metagenome]